jgi:hypothetical protein
MHKIVYVCIKDKGGADMRTILDLPEELLQEAMDAAHIKTKTKVIITALEELIRKHTISGIKTCRGRGYERYH